MIGEILEFKVRSGGTITIDLSNCATCQSKACIEVCQEQGGPLVLDQLRQVPTVKWSLEEIEIGGRVECLGCELDCELSGYSGVRIDLPLDRFDEYLESMTGSLVYQNKG